MQAVNGFFEDGRFTPIGITPLPRRFPAMLVFNEADVGESRENHVRRDDDSAWLAKFHGLLETPSNEELRLEDFPRMNLGREFISFEE